MNLSPLKHIIQKKQLLDNLNITKLGLPSGRTPVDEIFNEHLMMQSSRIIESGGGAAPTTLPLKIDGG